MRRGWAATAAVVALLLTAGCAKGADVKVPAGKGAPTVTVVASAFSDGGTLPAEFTCDGAGKFPAISWTDLPPGTFSVAVLVYDPDASGAEYVHRLVSNLTPSVGVIDSAATPAGALELPTSAGKPGWVAPCPPKGDGPHRYVFTVYALNRPTRLPATVQTQTAIATVTEAAIGYGTVTATYSRG